MRSKSCAAGMAGLAAGWEVRIVAAGSMRVRIPAWTSGATWGSGPEDGGWEDAVMESATEPLPLNTREFHRRQRENTHNALYPAGTIGGRDRGRDRRWQLRDRRRRPG